MKEYCNKRPKKSRFSRGTLHDCPCIREKGHVGGHACIHRAEWN